MYIIKPYFDFCPIQNTNYFVNFKYKLCDINTYKKDSMECVYQEFYNQVCSESDKCPIFQHAEAFVKHQ